jgi:hypothetical protein
MFLEAIASRRLRLAASGLTPQKARITNLDDTSLINWIEVSFNPQTIDYTACPEYDHVLTAGAPKGSRSNYAGMPPAKLSMELLFDTTMTGDNVTKKYIEFLIKLTVPIEKRGKNGKKKMQPPTCKFTWGKFTKAESLSFVSVLTELSVKYYYFLPDGTPVRASTNVTFQPPDELVGAQNPTSRSEARRVWRVVEGQTLDWIAFQEYGDTAAWRHIAQVNQLQNPRDLKPGTILKLVPLP